MGSRLLARNCININNMSNEVARKLANRIVKLRAERGLSQEGLAFAADIDRTYVGRIENLKRNPSLNILVKIAKAFDIEVWELLKFDDCNEM